MRVMILALLFLAFRVGVCLSGGYLITVGLFPLAFESYSGGLEITAMFSILVALCFPFSRR